MTGHESDRGSVLPALLLSVLIVLLAPFAGLFQKRLLTVLSDDYRPVLAIVFLLALIGLIAAALLHVHRQPSSWPRTGLILLGVVLMAIQLFGWNRQEAAVNAVERLHFLYFGLLALLYFRHFRRRGDWSAFPLALIAVTLVGLADESLQFLVAVRVGDGLDVALNAYAGLCGLLVATAVSPQIPRRPLSTGSRRLVAGAMMLLTLLLAIFVDRLHIGHEICDDSLDACFRSAYTADELEQLSAARAQRWRQRAPTAPGPLDLEDRYHAEAVRRVLYRRAAAASGDLDTAWKENELLERYFEPFLELGARWPPRRRAHLERERPGLEASPYSSPVFRSYGGRLFVPPARAVLWVVAVSLAAAWSIPLWAKSDPELREQRPDLRAQRARGRPRMS